MPSLAAEGLTAERLATLARRLQRAEAALRHAVAAASERVSLTPWAEGARVVFDRERFFALPDEIAMRLLGHAITHAGNEGQAELGKLEALFAALAQAQGRSVFRRTLAGAMVTARGEALVIERAPPRRPRLGKPVGRRIPALTTRKTGSAGGVGTR
jgi:tRNA(Ile)-lysidine synthase